VRSYLYVPGDAPDALATALEHNADAVVVDLVDTAPPARTAVARWLRTLPTGAPVWVRINPGPVGHDDAREVVGPNLRGLCVARTESTTQLDALDAVLSMVETEAGLPPRAVPLAPSLETAGAILAAPSIARAGRVERLHLGETDLRAELGIDASPDERELTLVRSQVVLASAAAGLAPPVGPASPSPEAERVRASAQLLRRLGFHGRACWRPEHVAVIHDVFTPSEAALAEAQDTVDRYAAAAKDGLSAVDSSGRTIDGASLRAARRILTLAVPPG
jgi:citrate lyase subunit beta/citryl-CoA lyase